MATGSQPPTNALAAAAPTPPPSPPHGDVAVAAAVDAVAAAAKAPDFLLTQAEWNHLSRRDQRMLRAIFERIARRQAIVQDPAEMMGARKWSERLSDTIAQFGGSWTFILIFLGILAAWIFANVVLLRGTKRFDAYPFIFLNLMLSMVAALQAPVIMMSQNRQTKRDRMAAENDYAVNMRAESEIRELHDKLDGLREGQWMQLVAQQEEQIKLLSILCERPDPSTTPG